MAFTAEARARLSLDTTPFEQAIARSGRMLEGLKGIMKVGGAGMFGNLLGSGAIIQGFRAIINRAQEARDAAKELGRQVDEGTASVARYADAWDGIKRSIGDAAIVGLSFFTRVGEKSGAFFNDHVMGRLRGMSPEDAARTRRISEEAGANADRLSSPQAMTAAKARGEAKRAADAQLMGAVARQMTEGTERREKAEFEALTTEQQIAALEQRRLHFQRDFADSSKSALRRATAFNNLGKTETELATKRAALEKEKAELAREQASITAKRAEFEGRLAELEEERAAIGENEEQRANRLRQQAARDLRIANDLSRSESDRYEARIAAQSKINDALEIEFRLRKAALSLGDVASGGGPKRQPMNPGDLRNPMGYAPDRIYGPQENATPPSAWDLKYGPALTARNDALKAQYGVWGSPRSRNPASDLANGVRDVSSAPKTSEAKSSNQDVVEQLIQINQKLVPTAIS